MDYYYRIPDYPGELSAATVLVRMLDGLGFRFYWATDGLRREDYAFRPAADTMSIEELVMHVWQLMNWVSSGALGMPHRKPKGGYVAREQALTIIQDIRNRFMKMGGEYLEKLSLQGTPFWNIINGPFSDALTHTGQISSFRRLAGNPIAGANVFKGEPPRRRDEPLNPLNPF